jgi:phytanoyl-CoA hydroxylase
MAGIFRRIKFLYSLYNLFHPGFLRHNLALFKKAGIKKFYFSPVSSLDFEKLKSPPEGIPDSLPERISQLKCYGRLGASDVEHLLAYPKSGYAVLRGFFSNEDAKKAWDEIEKLIKNGVVKKNKAGKIMFAIHHSNILKQMGNHSDLLDILALLLGRTPKLFQSIHFEKGSEQPSHSDAIHMTTYPLGNLIACWVALEDIEAGSGALHFFPGSHLLPYYLNDAYNNRGGFWLTGDKPYTAYESMIQSKVEENGLEKKVFTARAGDVLIWHANLIHGGEPVTLPESTRKSMVFHYFGEGAICYH